MTQTRRDPKFRAEFGERLAWLIKHHLKIKLSTLATELGYGNDTVLRKVRNGDASLSVEKLRELATMPIDGTSARISADWLLTGRGTPLLEDGASRSLDPVAVRVDKAPKNVRRAIEHFLDVQEGRLLPDESG